MARMGAGGGLKSLGWVVGWGGLWGGGGVEVGRERKWP